jgi:broad specificity phosphatase PhoE
MELWMVAIAVVVGVVALFTPIPGNVFAAGQWFVHCWTYFFLCNDNKKIKTAPPTLTRTRSKRVRVVFIRHGESIWNCVANRFGVTWPVRAARYGLETLLMILGNRNDSVIIDSPLSPLGELQATQLSTYVRSADGQKHVPRDPKTSLVVSSNLRRAMATGAIGLDSRLRANQGERIVIDSCLQEGSRNADAQSFMTEKRRLADAPVLGHQTATSLGSLFDPSLSMGNKTRDSNVCKRIDAFAARIFGEGPNGLPALPGNPENVILVGHSLWFRWFFQRYLPATSTHIAKTKKMKNCAVVRFDFVVDEKGIMSVDEASILPLHLGFSK